MVNLYAATFGLSTAWIRNATPVEVGVDLRTIERSSDTLYDDTGDSISSDNPYWGELTGLYWIRNNISCEDGDIIGFCH